MQLHKRFILDIWKSSAYYDFQQSFKVPDTFYLHEKRIDWIFTGKSGKILKKKQDNSTVNLVKEFFCKLDQNESEDENNSQMVAFQLLASYDQGICYFHYLDLSKVCELIVDSFKKQDETEFNDESHADFNTAANSQQKAEGKLNQNVLSDKTTVIQRFQKSSCNEKNMICTEWNVNGRFFAQKRISNYESFRKEDEYKSYIIFEDENMSVNRELTQKDKQELLSISQHVVKAIELIHSERGKISNIQLLLTSINGSFYLLACNSLQFSNDSSLPQPWRVSYELKMKYPNETIHMQDALKEAQKYLQKIQNNKKVQQCECCKNFSTKLQQICSNKLIQIRMRRGVGISQFEAKQLKKKDFSDICEVCYQIFLEMHKINSFNQNQQNLITENSFISKNSVSILNSYRANSKREKRSQSNYESSDKSSKCNIKSERSYDYRSQNMNNCQSRNSMQNSRDNSVKREKENSVNIIRKTSINNLKEYSSSNTQVEQSTVNTRDYSSQNTRNSSSQRSSQRVPPLYFRISEKVKNNNNQLNKQHSYNQSQSTDSNTKFTHLTLNQLNSDNSNQQFFIDLPKTKKSNQITNDISNPYDISEISKTLINQDENTPFSSQSPIYQFQNTFDAQNIQFQSNKNVNQSNQIQENLTQFNQEIKNKQQENTNITQINKVESDQKPLKNKFGIKIALKNLKKDVKKQQEDIKSVIQEVMKDCQSIQLNLDTQQSENKRYSRTALKKITPRGLQSGVEEIPFEQKLQQQRIQSQSTEIRKSQDLLQKQLPPRSKNFSYFNRTGMSNQSTTNQSFSSNPQANNSLECPSLKAISANVRPIQESSENYLKDLLNQNINTQQINLVRNDQRLYSQDTIFSQRLRKNSFDQEQKTIVHQSSNEIIAYGEPQKTIHNESQEKLETKLISDNTISQEFLLNKDIFLDNYQDKNEQIQLFRVRRSQSFNKK